MKQEEKERVNDHGPSVFGSTLAQVRATRRDALDEITSRCVSPAVSPSIIYE